MKESEMPEGTVFWEIRGVYDGWSIAELPDGTFINRWDEKSYPRRYWQTQEFIDRELKEE